MFSAGLRFEVFQPNDPDPSISRGKENYAGIDYKYLKADIGEKNKESVIIRRKLLFIIWQGNGFKKL